MPTVTARSKQIQQPRGGYIKPSQFETQEIDDGKVLHEEENVHASIIGMAVDYLTRYAMGTKLQEAYAISLRGSENTHRMHEAGKYLHNIKGLDDKSIIHACKMVTFDVWYRNPAQARKAKTANEINPDTDTIQNICVMVERSVAFWNKYGPIVKDGFDFKPTGYTKTVSAGDGDFLTADTIHYGISKYQKNPNQPKNIHYRCLCTGSWDSTLKKQNL